MPAVNATPIGRIDPNFSRQLERIKLTDKTIYEGTLGTGHRKWQMPDGSPMSNSPCVLAWDYDLFNITGLMNPFYRDCPNRLYVRALTKGPPVGVDAQEAAIPPGEGRMADCQVEKIQVDYMAAMERAFRMRHMSQPRSAAHAAIRRKGHSTLVDRGMVRVVVDGVVQEVMGPVGGVFTTMIRYLNLLIEAGYNEGAVQLDTPGPGIIYNTDGTVTATV